MRPTFTIIAVAINFLVFITILATLLDENHKSNVISTLFFALMEAGLILNTLLICTAR